jgi:hypothetical protein
LKKHLFKLVIPLFVMLILICSGAALYYQITGSKFDPVQYIIELQSQHRRDEALDITKFFIENNTGDLKTLKEIESDLQYTSMDKLKSFTKGAVKGDVYNTYSGIGAVSSDLCVYGDIRDLGIQSWRFLKDEDTDVIVAVLSGLGIVLSAKPFAHVISSYSKNTMKYLGKVSMIYTGSIIHKIKKGTLSFKESKLVLSLLKKTRGQYPKPQQFFPTSKV